MIREVLRMAAAFFIVDGGLILLSGQSIAGDEAPNRVFDGFGLIAMGLGAAFLYIRRPQ